MSAYLSLTWPTPWWARITIGHSARMNAMTCAMWEQLAQAFSDIANAAQVRVVELVGDARGRAFCVGGDISEYQAFRFSEDTLAYFHEQQVWPGLRAVLACDVPVVAHINGACMGAGLELASCADIRIASSAAMFGAPIAKLGFPMAPKEAAVVAHAVGDAVARNVLLQAATYSAEQLHHTGFLAQVCEADELTDAVGNTMQRMAALSPQAARLNKQGLRQLWPLALQQAVGVKPASDDAYAYADSVQHREGIAAFIAKRPAQF